MNKVKLLDCTLRDGGYVNNWKFGKKKISSILNSLSDANMDIIECGFLMDKEYQKDYTQFPDVKDVYEVLQEPNPDILYVAMIAIGEKEIDPSFLSPAEEGPIKGIRLTFHQDELEKAFQWGKVIMDKGYKLFMQPVGSANYKDQVLLDLIKRINEMKPYAFYLVDTLGVMFPNDIKRMVYLVDNNLAEGIALGLHSHNNIQMSFSNAQDLMDFRTEREFFIDCSVYGMGRGAGNLCSELLTEYMNHKYDCHYDVLPLLECIDECLMPIYMSHPWGYSVAYFLAAAKGCHPNYASHLLAKQTVPVRKISILLDRIPEDKKLVYDKERIEEIYLKYQEHAVDDSKQIKKLEKEFAGKDILILAPGRSLKMNRAEIKQYIKKKKPYVIAISVIPDFPIDMLFISNSKRYEKIKEKIDVSKTVFTSNVSGIPDGAKVVNYSDLLNASSDVSDSAGMMLLKLLIKTKVKKVSLAGFDGFSGNQILNYMSNKWIGSIESVEFEHKNVAASLELRECAKEIKLNFITPTKYEV